MEDITYQPLTKEHHDEVRELICNTWRFDHYVPVKHLRLFVDTVLYSYLYECNYSQAALVGNKVVGVLLAHIAASPICLKYYMLMVYTLLKLSLDSEGRQYCKILKNISDCEKRVQEGSKRGDNRLLLLIVEKNMRNCGIGSTLIHHLQQECESYHLITDTLCNYSFYDGMGFQRVNTKQFLYFSGLEKMYLYRKQ